MCVGIFIFYLCLGQCLFGLGDVRGFDPKCSRRLEPSMGLEFGEICLGFRATGGAGTFALLLKATGWSVTVMFMLSCENC